MTTNLFVIANVKQLQTNGSFRISLPFFQTSWGVGVLNSATFNCFHNRVEFGMILEGLRSLGLKPPLGMPLTLCCAKTHGNQSYIKLCHNHGTPVNITAKQI